MDGSHSSTNSTPPFLTKTYDMVDDLSTDSVISWAESGSSFIVWNQVLLERELLPMYFKHNNFSSFIRQLNTYVKRRKITGVKEPTMSNFTIKEPRSSKKKVASVHIHHIGFRKVDPDLWEFANDDFRKGQRQLLKNIHRRKPTFSHSFHPNQGHVNRCGAISESEKQDLEEEIETLKRDKSAYMLDLHRHTQEQHKLESKSHDLVEKLHLTVQRQQQMLALLDSVVHKPDIVSSLLKPCESSKCSSVANKKRRLPTSNDAIENDGTEENQIADPQFVGADTSVSRFSQSLSVEAFYGMESSITFLENIFRRVGLASGESVDILDGSSLAVTEFPASSGSADIILPSELPKLDLPSITSELRQSVSHLGIIGTQHPEVRRPPLDSSRSSMIDMNLMPTTPEPKVSKKSATIGGAPTGANDVFWEQFLTETPGSVETHEVQPEMRGNDDKRYCNRSTEDPNFWSNKKNMDTLTEQMGQLTSVERK